MNDADEAARERTADGDLTYWRPAGLDGLEILEARDCPRRWRMMHETFTFCTVRSGGGQFEYRRRSHDVERGTTHLLEPGNLHRDLVASPRNNFDVVFVAAPAVAASLGIPEEKLPHFRDGLSRSPRIANALHMLVKACKRAETELETRSWLSELVGTAFAAHGETRGVPRPARQDVRRVMRLIQARYAEPLSLDELAAAAGGVTTFHLIRAFRSSLGITPHQYLIQQRIARARHLLQRPGASVATVAAEVGFGDQSHLHRHFVSTLGVTPGRYAKALGAPGATTAP
jgi:AraC-like DNA-binding protein